MLESIPPFLYPKRDYGLSAPMFFHGSDKVRNGKQKGVVMEEEWYISPCRILSDCYQCGESYPTKEEAESALESLKERYPAFVGYVVKA